MIGINNINLSSVGKTSLVVSMFRTLISNKHVKNILLKVEDGAEPNSSNLEQIQSYLPFYTLNPYISDIPNEITIFDPKECQAILWESLDLVYFLAPDLFKSKNFVNLLQKHWSEYDRSKTNVDEVRQYIKNCPPLKAWSLVAIENISARIALRTMLIDDLIQSSIVGQFKQVVILGSGLDSRLLRMPLGPDVVGYEVDLPEIIELKKKLLPLITKECPPTSKSTNHYIGADLKGDSWIELLKSAGSSDFDSTKPTLWIMEGLLMYLSEDETNNLISNCSHLSSSGSTMVIQIIGHVDGEKDPQFRKLVKTLLHEDVRFDFKKAAGSYLKDNSFISNVQVYNDNDIFFKYTGLNDPKLDDGWSQFAIGYKP
ncbi:hypothetical protein PPL_09615 [Heterostelium album PN500]|uniref:S-adenosyl-L-methionine-dependent methyltransferase n=1 Tax=Heterostelium pallidum (strain ATCC 26659 / Pp 5 / PN500) TaxID=670386 RepID=D3BNU4_HETP5|nr:hypothetical protein PPL_09615 [Heterostelium album PN500]EFA76863.1 hypothetical protein PPL_09615 [Heterostelium album PN500]|eukprot:XP_020428995.1 hypothetical protein PPL_09615 [Heterostelium album PN500]